MDNPDEKVIEKRIFGEDESLETQVEGVRPEGTRQQLVLGRHRVTDCVITTGLFSQRHGW